MIYQTREYPRKTVRGDGCDRALAVLGRWDWRRSSLLSKTIITSPTLTFSAVADKQATLTVPRGENSIVGGRERSAIPMLVEVGAAEQEKVGISTCSFPAMGHLYQCTTCYWVEGDGYVGAFHGHICVGVISPCLRNTALPASAASSPKEYPKGKSHSKRLPMLWEPNPERLLRCCNSR